MFPYSYSQLKISKYTFQLICKIVSFGLNVLLLQLFQASVQITTFLIVRFLSLETYPHFTRIISIVSVLLAVFFVVVVDNTKENYRVVSISFWFTITLPSPIKIHEIIKDVQKLSLNVKLANLNSKKKSD